MMKTISGVIRIIMDRQLVSPGVCKFLPTGEREG